MGMSEFNGASRVRKIILGCGLIRKGRRVCTESLWESKSIFPKGRMDQSGPGTVLGEEYTEIGSEKWAEM